MIVVSQGPIFNRGAIEHGWKIPVLHSTWECEERAHNVIINKIPEFKGKSNLNLQKISTISGLKAALADGYRHVINTRSDLIPIKPSGLIQKIDWNKLNFLFWNKRNEGYLVDYWMAGEAEKLLELWEAVDETIQDFPERALTEAFFALFRRSDLNFLGKSLVYGESDLYWAKKGIYLSSYNQNVDFTCEI